jgi:hypothetical protein
MCINDFYLILDFCSEEFLKENQNAGRIINYNLTRIGKVKFLETQEDSYYT